MLISLPKNDLRAGAIGFCASHLSTRTVHETVGIQELCKLTHVVADLRVLVAYFDPRKKGELSQFLQDRINLMEKHERRMTRVPDSEWLFIFGPERTSLKSGEVFRAFTLQGTQLMQILSEGEPISPSLWPVGRPTTPLPNSTIA